MLITHSSKYACLGLWVSDARNIYSPLRNILSTNPDDPTSLAPLSSYPFLTEITRNPRSARNPVEKNWFLFFPTPSTSFVHYDITSHPTSLSENRSSTSSPGGRSFAKLIGNGFATPNLASPSEQPCLPDPRDALNRSGHWHQATNSLKLLLCRRVDVMTRKCNQTEEERAVHFAVIHRKFSNEWDLPLRYERYFIVWDSKPPFRMLAMSRWPILLRNETASGWSGEENWSEKVPNQSRLAQRWDSPLSWNTTTPRRDGEEAKNWAYFTYTPSIAWARRPKSNHQYYDRRGRFDESSDPAFSIDDGFESFQIGFLDDEVILGIGIEDTQQGFARAQAEVLLQGLRICPGV
ncbi:MAG: hypothetical protein Q9227_008202 [Pyrenula ochraceoflavens]